MPGGPVLKRASALNNKKWGNIKIKKKMFSAVICVMMVIGIMGSAFGVSADSDEISTTPVKISDKMLVSQIEELLLDSSPAERELLLEKVSYAGITSNDLPNVSLSKNEVAILEGKVSITKQTQTNKRILTASSNSIQSTGASLYTPMTNVAGVDMPDYALWPTIYKQKDVSSCSAGTVYTILQYIKGSSPSQTQIMSDWQSIWGVTIPDLHFNEKLS